MKHFDKSEEKILAKPKVIPVEIVIFNRGIKMFEDGLPCPQNVWTDEEWRRVCNHGMILYLGWMMGRARMLQEQNRIRDWAENGGSLER